MTEAVKRISRIENIVEGIEALDKATEGKFRQAEDREAFDILSRIERQMAQKVSRETSKGDAA